MTAAEETTHPPKAVVGSQVSQDEEMFGRAFDGRVIRRFLEFCHPYRTSLAVAVVSVLVYTATQVAIPLVILYEMALIGIWFTERSRAKAKAVEGESTDIVES